MPLRLDGKSATICSACDGGKQAVRLSWLRGTRLRVGRDHQVVDRPLRRSSIRFPSRRIVGRDPASARGLARPLPSRVRLTKVNATTATQQSVWTAFTTASQGSQMFTIA